MNQNSNSMSNALPRGVMLNAYPDSIDGDLAGTVRMLQRPEFADVFSLFYVLPTVFHSDLDRGFSIVDYDLNEGDGGWRRSFGFLGGNSRTHFVFGEINGDGYQGSHWKDSAAIQGIELAELHTVLTAHAQVVIDGVDESGLGDRISDAELADAAQNSAGAGAAVADIG